MLWTVGANAQSPAPELAKSVVVFRNAASPARLFKAVKWEQYQAMIFVTREDGARQGLPASDLQGSASLPDGDSGTWSEEAILSSEKAFLALAGKFPAMQSELDPYILKLSQAATERKEAPLRALSASIDSLVSHAYSPSIPLAEIKSLLDSASDLSAKSADRAGEIATWAQPWKDHVAKVDSGLAWENGAWTSPVSEIATAIPNPSPVEEKPPTPKRNPMLHVPSTVVSGTAMLGILGGLALLALLLFTKVFGYFTRLVAKTGFDLCTKEGRIAATKQKPRPGVLSHLLHLWFIIILAGSGGVVWILCSGRGSVETFRSKHGLAIPQTSGVMKNVMEGASPMGPGEMVAISPQEADTYFKTYIEFDQQEESSLHSFALVRKGFAGTQTEDSTILAEEVLFLNQPVLVEYQIPKASHSEAGTVAMSITANGLPVPGLIASYLWSKISEDLASAYKNSQLGAVFEFRSVGDAGLIFRTPSAPKQDF